MTYYLIVASVVGEYVRPLLLNWRKPKKKIFEPDWKRYGSPKGPLIHTSYFSSFPVKTIFFFFRLYAGHVFYFSLLLAWRPLVAVVCSVAFVCFCLLAEVHWTSGRSLRSQEGSHTHTLTCSRLIISAGVTARTHPACCSMISLTTRGIWLSRWRFLNLF